MECIDDESHQGERKIIKVSDTEDIDTRQKVVRYSTDVYQLISCISIFHSLVYMFLLNEFDKKIEFSLKYYKY